MLDFAGPAAVFANARRNGRSAFRVFTLAPRSGSINTNQSVRVERELTIAICPRPDILVISGGDTDQLTTDPAFMQCVSPTVPNAEVTLTVCTGVFTLAKPGLLDGKEATPHDSAIPGLQRDAPEVRVRDDARLCDNGQLLTAAGIAAGIDGALHVVSRLCRESVARDTARYMEYRRERSTAR